MDFEKYFDKYRLLVGSKEDPGDSIQRTYMYRLGMLWFARESILTGFHMMLRCSKGNYKRHAANGWWSDCDRMSRDQMTSVVIWLAETKHNVLFKEFYVELLKRFGFFTNTRRNGATKENHGKRKWPNHPTNFSKYDYSKKIADFVTLKFLAIWIRGANAWYLRPLLYLLDLEALIGTIRHNKTKESDVLNHLICSHYFIRKYPTIISKFSYRLINREVFNRKLDTYFKRVGLEPMCELWKFR